MMRIHVRDHDALGWVRNIIVLAIMASIFESTKVPALHDLGHVMVACAIFISVLLLAVPATVRFGSDGMCWTHPLYARKPAFFSYGDVGDVSDIEHGVRYKHVKYTHIDTVFGRARWGANAEAIRHELHARLSAYRSAAASHPMSDVVVTAQVDGYRSNQTPELLLDLLAAPHAKAIQRSKAARRLVDMQGDDETKAAIRAIAAATADPWLREQLERASASDVVLTRAQRP